MQIRRIPGLLLVLVLAFSLTACGNNQQSQTSTGSQKTKPPVTENATQVSEQNDTSAGEHNTGEGSKVLVIYFSADNTKDVDAVSSATPMADGTSSVRWIAEIIHENVGGDIAEIIPSEDYPLGYDELADAAKKEADSDERPAIEALDIDPTSYDTVFIGYPIWWYKLPMVMETFFDNYDFTGVIIIPFNTHAGSRTGGTYDMIRDREPGANVVEGLAVRGEDVGKDSARNSVEEWLDGLNLE